MANSETKTEGVKAFSDAKPKFSLQVPAILAASSCVVGYVCGSGTLTAALLFGVFVNTFTDVVVSNILVPPFMDNRPGQPLTTQPGKVCPYWPAATIAGPASMGIKYEDVEFPTKGGRKLRGWLIRSDRSKNVLICTHGAGRDRRAWLRHTPFLIAAGHSVLLFDFLGHGASDKREGKGGTSLGESERVDVIAAVEYVKRTIPGAKISLIGTSTGAVAAILACATDSHVKQSISCIVAENPFKSPESVASMTVAAVVFKVLICKNNNLAYTLLYPLMKLVQAVSVIKVRRELARQYGVVLATIDMIRKIETPMLLMHGTEDKIVSVNDTLELITVAGVDAGPLGHATRKQMWLCENAEHCQLWDIDREEFESRVLQFLEKFT